MKVGVASDLADVPSVADVPGGAEAASVPAFASDPANGRHSREHAAESTSEATSTVALTGSWPFVTKLDLKTTAMVSILVAIKVDVFVGRQRKGPATKLAGRCSSNHDLSFGRGTASHRPTVDLGQSACICRHASSSWAWRQQA